MTEVARARWARVSGRLFGLQEIGAILQSATATPFAFAGVLSVGLVFVPRIDVMAIIGLAEETTEGIAPILMTVRFHQHDKPLRGLRAFEEDTVRGVHRHDLDLVTW